MPFNCSKHCKIVFDHLRLTFNEANTVLMCKMCLKYQYASQPVCAYVHDFRKRPECALIGACAVIRMNMVFIKQHNLMLTFCHACETS